MVATFSLLFKRNFYIEKGLWRRTLFEVIVIAIMLIVILINPISHSKRLLYTRTEYQNEMNMVSNKLEDILILTSLVDSKREKTKYMITYSPITKFTKEVCEEVAKTLNLNGSVGMDDEEMLVNQFDERTTLAGIVFPDLLGETVPKLLKIAIRFPSEFRTVNSYLSEDRLWVTRCSGLVNSKRDNVKDEFIGQDIYIREGFLQLQHQIFMEWYHRIRREIAPDPSFTEPHVEMHNIRLKGSDESCTAVGVSSVPDFLFNFLYLLPFLNIIRNITAQLKDNVMVHQWQYGYSFCKQWGCLVLVLLLRLLLLGLLIVLMIFIFWTVENGNVAIKTLLLLIVFICLYTIALILTAFVYSKIFPHPINAALFGLVIWVFSYAAFGIILDRYWDVRNNYEILIMMSFFNNQIPFSMQLFHRLIAVPEEIDRMDIAILFGSTLLCILIHLVLLVLLQWRLPGYLLSRRIVAKKRKKKKKKRDDFGPVYFGRSPSWHNFEFGDVGSTELVRLRRICTAHLNSEHEILKNISLRLYKGEIFVLLGHIGSGKITMLRIICGLKFPKAGVMHFEGEDFHENIYKYRNWVDFRTQHNGLVPFLSVEQTIAYHVRLKLSSRTADRFDIEKRKWLEYLDPLIENRKAHIGNLTFGERRMVSLCCALAGETKILVLDEPTQGLTGREAHAFWTIIMREKEERSIMVCTHSVDEAERIADRIGVMSMGVLEASGTPFFLRAKFSSKVELVLIKKPHVPDQPITEFLKQFIADIEPENEIGDTLTYKIDLDKRPKLQRLLIHLENERKALGIENMRVVGSDMSDIYMRLVTSFRLKHQVIPDVTQTFKYAVVSKKKLRRQQMRAMFYKKMIHSAPNIWPIIMIFTSFIIIVLIARLAVVLDVPDVRDSSISIGFKSASNAVEFIPNVKSCGYIDIKSLTKTHAFKKTNAVSRTFTATSFECVKGSYMEHLNSKLELNSLGAVEAQSEQDLQGFISQDTFHSAPMALNLLHNIVLKLAFVNRTDVAFLVINHPMPTPLSLKINLLDNEIAHINAPLAIGCILPLALSVFILPLVEEQMCQLRVLQLIAGIGLDVYWGINFVWDLFTFFIYSVIFVIIVGVAGIGGFGIFENFLLLLLLLVFGLAGLPMTYLLSMFVNESMVRGFLASLLMQGLTGLVLYIIYWDVANSNAIFFYGASMAPGFSLLDGISNIYTQCLEQSLCRTKCAAQNICTIQNMHDVLPNCQFDTYFKWAEPGILPAMTFMLLGAIFFMLLIFWVELHRKEQLFHSKKDLHKMRTATYPFDDADVADVKMKIAEADMSKCKQSVFLVDQVEAKIPDRGNKINTVSFALNKYMSMGIFGQRNAGKSHLIRQLVGIDGFAFGEIYVRGLDLKYDLHKIQTYIGYCPQHGGLLSELTPREHIRLLCMIRGVPEPKIGEKMHDLCLMLNMTGWMHRKVCLLTAEKRRKLNVALALVAYNKVFVLDEPTSGMPATTRREIWNILRYIRYCGKTIIFASSDELECKVLADFIILFQSSEMLAIGSMQYLRYKYSHGFYLEVRLIRDGATAQESEANLRKDVDNLARFVNFLHDQSEMVGRLHNWFKFYVPVGNIVYSYLYGAMEKNKVRLNVFDYCIYQASMSNVISQVQETRTELKRRQIQNNNVRPTSTAAESAKLAANSSQTRF